MTARTLSVLVAALMGLSLSGCGDDGEIQTLAQQNGVYEIGYPPAGSPTSVSYSSDFLQAYAVTVPAPTKIVGFSLWMVSLTGPTSGKMALYADVAGEPGSLVTASLAQPLAVGRTMMLAPATPVPAGNYWLVKRLSLSGNVSAIGGTSISRRYLAYPFGNPWPDPMPAMSPTPSNQVNLAALAVN